MTTIVDLLAAIGAHLAEFELPAIASVHVTAAMSTPQVTVQLDCRAPSVIAQGLLAWADTLTEITTEAWRVPQGDSVHLSVTGLLPGGATVQVYGGMPITDCRPGAGLKPDTTTTLPLATLRQLTTPRQATEEVTLS
jgi:hypothetical protein